MINNDMAEVADYNFFKSLNANVFDLSPKILDELHLALEHSEKPIEQTMQVISEMHGPYNGSSEKMAEFVNSFAGKLGKFESALTKSKSLMNSKAEQIKSIVSEIKSTVNLINKTTASQMNTPMLRAFIGEAQKLNPLVNDLIQREIDRFPMFQQVSESIGMFFNIHVTKTALDVSKTLKNNTGYTNYDTNMILRKNSFKKSFRPISEMIERSHVLTDSLSYRCIPQNDIANYHKNYGDSTPFSHGYNNCQDVYHLERMKNARNGSLIKLINTFGDQLRLLNTFFPVTISLDYGTESQEIMTEHGPVLVDEHGRGYDGYNNSASVDNLEALASSEIKQSIKC